MLVLILLILFLGNLRAALTVALVLPLAALITFLLMRQFGMSANLMSLGGLAIAIGMLVDAAVVVVENIATQLGQKREGAPLPRLHIRITSYNVCYTKLLRAADWAGIEASEITPPHNGRRR